MTYQNTSTEVDRKTFDLKTTGYGFVNRIREVAFKGGKPYLACDLSLQEGVATGGDYSNITKTRFDANVVGKKAIALLRENLSIDDKSRLGAGVVVKASVVIGGMVPKIYTYKDKNGKEVTAVSVKTRLLKFNYLSIGSQVIDVSDDDGKAEEGKAEANQVAKAEAEATEPEANPVAKVKAKIAEAVAAESNSEAEAEAAEPVASDCNYGSWKAKYADYGYSISY